jgi:hypothetical protein
MTHPTMVELCAFTAGTRSKILRLDECDLEAASNGMRAILVPVALPPTTIMSNNFDSSSPDFLKLAI